MIVIQYCASMLSWQVIIIQLLNLQYAKHGISCLHGVEKNAKGVWFKMYGVLFQKFPMLW